MQAAGCGAGDLAGGQAGWSSAGHYVSPSGVPAGGGEGGWPGVGWGERESRQRKKMVYFKDYVKMCVQVLFKEKKKKEH